MSAALPEPKALLSQYKAHMAAKRWVEAVEILTQLLGDPTREHPGSNGSTECLPPNSQSGRQAPIPAQIETALPHLAGRTKLYADVIKALLHLQRWEDAGRYLMALEAIDPESDVTLEATSALAHARGDYANSIRALEMLLGRTQGTAAQHCRISQDLEKLGRPTEARARLEAGLIILPDSPLLLAEAVSQAHRTRSHDFVIAHAERLFAMRPTNARPLLWLAHAYREKGRPAEAEATLQQAIAALPTNIEAMIGLGDHLQLQGRVEEARQTFQKARDLEPLQPAPWQRLVVLERDLGSPFDALVLLAAAREAQVESLFLAEQEIRLQEKLGLLDKADANLSNAMRRWPRERRLTSIRQRIDMELGRFEAVAHAISLLPEGNTQERAERQAQLGHLAMARFEITEALQYYRAVLTELPNDRRSLDGVMCGSLMRLRVDDAHAAYLRLRRLNAADRRERGLQPAPLRHLMRPLVNEARIQAGIAEAGKLTLERQSLEALLEVHGGTPDFTPTAIALVSELRRRCMLEPEPPSDAPPVVPRLIHQYWDKPNAPPEVVNLMSSWQGRNPGWAWQRLDRAMAREYLLQNFPPEVARAFRLTSQKPAQQADLLRLALLHREGGVWADADDLCTAPLAAHLGGARLTLRQERYGTVGNNFIASVPRHPVIDIALEEATQSILRGDSESIWISTGPGLLTRSLARYLAESPRHLSEIGREIVVLAPWNLRRFCAPHVKIAYKRAGGDWLSQETQFQGA